MRLVLAVLLLCLEQYAAAQSGITPASVGEFDVVPPWWITADGRDHSSVQTTGKSEPAAYVFPSLPPSAPEGTQAAGVLIGFFDASSSFPVKPTNFNFEAPSGNIVITLNRSGVNAHFLVDGGSVKSIQQLRWTDFRTLQSKFRKWLCRRSGSSFFIPCESRFTEKFNVELVRMWKDCVLAKADFQHFARTYLDPVPEAVKCDGCPMEIDLEETRMNPVRLVPGQSLSITWGASSVYPPFDEGGYSRTTSAGTTDLRLNWDGGIRVLPKGTLRLAGKPYGKEMTTPDEAPYPKEWKSLFGTLFVPIYSMYDLYNRCLLVTLNAPVNPDNCPETPQPQAPKYLYLLMPASYAKADVVGGGEIFQFESEARNRPIGGSEPAKEVSALARRFALVGCNGDLPCDLVGEWSRILKEAFQASGGAKIASEQKIVSGVFFGKTFVEVRNHFSINGGRMERSAQYHQTIGQTVDLEFPAGIYRERQETKGPFVEVRRTLEDGHLLRKERIYIRFHTSDRVVLNQAEVHQGDEIYAGRLPKSLREQ